METPTDCEDLLDNDDKNFDFDFEAICYEDIIASMDKPLGTRPE